MQLQIKNKKTKITLKNINKEIKRPVVKTSFIDTVFNFLAVGGDFV